MITTRQVNLEMELLHWLLLVIAASALVLAVASALGAADPRKEPRLLPDDMGTIAKPMPPESARPFFPEYPPERALPAAEAAARLWMTLEGQRAGCIGEALAGWGQVNLPEETAHWQEIGMAAAYLKLGDFHKAEVHLDVARELAPQNAVVAYFTGLMRIEQAAANGSVPDDKQRERDVLVAYTPAEDQLLCRMLAIAELRNAIARVGEIRLDERLMATDPQIEETIVVPRVGDLLVALGADNFVGQSHHLLYGLLRDRGNLTVAEFHLDQAAGSGIPVADSYRGLAAAYLDDGRSADGLRVARKDLDVNHPWVRPLCDRLIEMTLDSAKAIWVW